MGDRLKGAPQNQIYDTVINKMNSNEFLKGMDYC